MRVLVACEFSAVVRDAVRSRTLAGIAAAMADRWGR